MWYNLKKNLLQSSTLGKLLMVLLLGLSVTLKEEDQFQEASFLGEGGLGDMGGTPHPTIFFDPPPPPSKPMPPTGFHHGATPT